MIPLILLVSIKVVPPYTNGTNEWTVFTVRYDVTVSWYLDYTHFTGFYKGLLAFAGFYWLLLAFTGFYWLLLAFTGFYWVESTQTPV